MLLDNYRTYKRLPEFIKSEILIILSQIMVYTIVGFAVTKVKGLALTLTVIATIATLSQIVSLGSHLIKDIKTEHKYLIMMILSVVMITVLFSYSQLPAVWWVVTFTVVSAIEGIFVDSFFIDYDSVLKEICDSVMFKDIQYLERFAFTICGLLSGALGIWLSSLYTIEIVLYIAAVGNTLSVVFIYGQYRKFYKGLVTQRHKDEKRVVGKMLMSFDTYKTNKLNENKVDK